MDERGVVTVDIINAAIENGTAPQHGAPSWRKRLTTGALIILIVLCLITFRLSLETSGYGSNTGRHGAIETTHDRKNDNKNPSLAVSTKSETQVPDAVRSGLASDGERIPTVPESALSTTVAATANKDSNMDNDASPESPDEYQPSNESFIRLTKLGTPDQFISSLLLAEPQGGASKIIKGIYVDPYDNDKCDVMLDPCDTLRDSASTLALADPDATRPAPNTYRILVRPGSTSRQGRTALAYFRGEPADRREFERHPAVYNDLGVPPLRSPATNAPLPEKARWRYSAENFEYCNLSFPHRFLAISQTKGGYGLTNRLLSQFGTLALAARVGRYTILEKGRQLFGFTDLIDVNATHWSPRVRFVKKCKIVVPIDIRKKLYNSKAKNGYQQIDRREVSIRPHRVLTLLDRGFLGMRNLPAVIFHEMYQRYPYEQDGDLGTNLGTMLCSSQFVPSITSSAHLVIRKARELAFKKTNGENRKYAALHFRQEVSDSIGMRSGRKEPNAKQIKDFVSKVLVPELMLRRIKVLVVCSGTLPSFAWNALVSAGKSHNVTVVSKMLLLPKNVTFNNFGTKAFSTEGSVRIEVTPTDGAAADLLVMERADIAFLTTTSSFSCAVYAKRCGGSVYLASSITWNLTRSQLGLPNDAKSESIPGRYFDVRGSGCSLVGNVMLYDCYADGTFTKLVELPCGYQFGQYILAPPAVVPRVPAELNVVSFRYRPQSPLFVEKWRNNEMTRPGEK